MCCEIISYEQSLDGTELQYSQYSVSPIFLAISPMIPWNSGEDCVGALALPGQALQIGGVNREHLNEVIGTREHYARFFRELIL